MENSVKCFFELKQWGNFIYPVVKRKKGNLKIDECPFCGVSHTHDLGEGHRIPHCTDKHGYLKEIIINGNILIQARGYFIEEY